MKTSITIDEVNQWQYSNELNPLYLNYICTLNGHYPVQIESGFNYCELGCGVGVTLNGLAELFLKGKFFGIDNNIDYIDAAVALLKELTVLILISSLQILLGSQMRSYQILILLSSMIFILGLIKMRVSIFRTLLPII